MAKAYGFTRTVKRTWLDRTVEMVLEGMDENQIRAELDEYLCFELKDKTNIGKARNILMNVWVSGDAIEESIRNRALDLYKRYPDDTDALHWSMMIMAYPVFADMSKLIGKISEFQSEISLTKLREKIFDDWGESTTLLYSVEKIVATMKDLDAFVPEKKGIYHIEKKQVNRPAVVEFMLYAAMKIEDSGYNTVTELKEFPLLFPFKYEVDVDGLMECELFYVANYGGERTISIK